MRLFIFEWRKLWRGAGVRYFIFAVFLLNILYCFFAPAESYDFETQKEYISRYEDDISYVIRTAERNLEEYKALGSVGYVIRYQNDVIRLYQGLIDIGTEPEEVRGWNEFFDIRSDDVIILLVSVFAGAVMEMTEHDNGTRALLLLTLRGKKSARTKAAVLGIFAVCYVVLMEASTLLITAIRFGVSPSTAALCSVFKFEYVPFAISIAEYLTVSVLIKAANAFSVMLSASFLASFFKSYLISFSLPLAAVLIGYLMLMDDGASFFFDPYTIGFTDPLFARYRSVNVFEHSFSLIFAAALGVTSAVLIFSVFLDRGLKTNVGVGKIAEFEKLIVNYCRELKNKLNLMLPKPKPRRHGLLYIEAEKSLIKSRLIILCVLMLFVKVRYAEYVKPEIHPGEEFYRELCYDLCGALTEEKRTLIYEKLSECRDVISKHDSMRAAVQNGTLTGNEYSEYLDELSRAEIEEYAYSRLAEQCLRIETAHEAGLEAYIMYDSGWQSLLFRERDAILCIFLLLFFAGIYDIEYKSGFDKIAQTTARGFGALRRAKGRFAIAAGASAFVLFFLVDLFYLLEAYTFPCGTFPLASITSTSSTVSVITAVLLKYTAEISLMLLFSVLMCGLSRLMKRVYLALPAGALAAVLIIFL